MPPDSYRASETAGTALDSPPREVAVAAGILVRLAGLLDDLRVLAEHLTSHADGNGAQTPGQAGLAAALDAAARLLAVPPEAIVRDAALLGQLYGSLAAMTALAAPANVTSIRLTRAFVHGSGPDGALSSVTTEARHLMRWAWASAVFGLLVFLSAIVLLVHVDRGRRALQQFVQVQKEYQTIATNISVARIAASTGVGLGVGAGTGGNAGMTEAGLACAAGDPTRPSQPTAPEPAAPRQERLLCDELQATLVRMRIARNELRIWNTISDRLSFASPVAWLSPASIPASGLSEQDWEPSDLRTSVMMAALTGFVMPMLLGLLGACVYVYREVDNQIRTSTLEARQSVHGTLRMLLGAILGGMLGAIWTNGQTVQLEGVSLSLGALAFFVGFSVEIVFSTVDRLVRTVAGRVDQRPP